MKLSIAIALGLILQGTSNFNRWMSETSDDPTLNNEVTAQIDTMSTHGILVISGKVLNRSLRERSLSYSLMAVKRGVSGKSSTRQAGRCVVSPDQEVEVSHAAVNIVPSDSCKIELTIEDEEARPCARAFLLIQPQN